ncbi:MAG: hypothetical protein ACK5PS_08925 [Desulfopila sp.]
MKPSLKIRSEGFQHPHYRIARFTFEDFPTTDFVPAVELPGDAIPIGGFLAIDSAMDASSTLAVGTAAAPTSFLGATGAAAAAKTALLAAFQNAGKPLGGNITDGLTASAAMTKGSGYLVVEYIRNNYAHGTQG